MSKLSDFRKSYELGELDEAEAADGPLALFNRWMDEAISHDVSEPTAMTLATVGANGRPSTRVVLLKGCDARGFVWFTNYESRKGEELEHLPFAALQFHWVEMERVVRIEGKVEKTSAQDSDNYFKSRPLDSRLGAWASPQSRVISSRAVLVANGIDVRGEAVDIDDISMPAVDSGRLILSHYSPALPSLGKTMMKLEP